MKSLCPECYIEIDTEKDALNLHHQHEYECSVGIRLEEQMVDTWMVEAVETMKINEEYFSKHYYNNSPRGGWL